MKLYHCKQNKLLLYSWKRSPMIFAKHLLSNTICWKTGNNLTKLFFILFIYNIRRIARLFPTVHYALNLRDAARNEFFEKVMERRYDFRCRRKPKCSEKTCAGKYGSRTKFTYDSGPTGNRTRAALVKGTGTTAAPTRPPPVLLIYYCSMLIFAILPWLHIQIPPTGYIGLIHRKTAVATVR